MSLVFGILWLLGPACGMVGGLQYRSGCTMAYIIFLCVKCLVLIYFFIFSTSALQFVVYTLMVFLNIYILRFVLMFYKVLTVPLIQENLEYIRSNQADSRRRNNY